MNISINFSIWEKKNQNELTCLNCSSKLQFCWELKFCWVCGKLGLLLCWEDGVVGWLGGLAGGMGENVVCGGWNPKTDADENGILPAWPPRPASRFCELAKKSRCLLKASKAGSGGKFAKMALGSNCSFSSESSLIKCRGSLKNKSKMSLKIFPRH